LIIRWRFVGGIGAHWMDADGRDRQRTASWPAASGLSARPVPARCTGRSDERGLRHSWPTRIYRNEHAPKIGQRGLRDERHLIIETWQRGTGRAAANRWQAPVPPWRQPQGASRRPARPRPAVRPGYGGGPGRYLPLMPNWVRC